MTTQADNETQIRKQINVFVEAFQTKDIELMMSLYAQEFVSFDIIPPLQYVGTDAYRKVWKETFALFQDQIDIEIKNVNITAGDDVAFSYKFLHLNTMRTNGQKIDYWERLTFCFRKIDGKWLMTHEHVSLPTNLESGKAVLDLKP